MRKYIISLVLIATVILVGCAEQKLKGRHFVGVDFYQTHNEERQEAVRKLLVEKISTFNQDEKQKITIAIIPFENWTNHPNAGLIASQLMATELYTREMFVILEETSIKRILDKKKINIARLPKTGFAEKIAKLLRVDALVIGSVSEYQYQHGLHEEPTVGISARMVSREGIVFWASSHSEVGSGYLRRDSLNESAQRMIKRMVDELVLKIRGYMFKPDQLLEFGHIHNEEQDDIVF